MEKAFQYKILREHKLICQIYHGKIELNDVKAQMQKITSDPDFSPDLHLLTDLRDCELNLTPAEVTEYVNFLKLKLIHFKPSPHNEAFITSDSYTESLSILYSIQLKSNDIKSDRFDTLDEAIEHVANNRELISDIRKKFLEFKKEFSDLQD